MTDRKGVISAEYEIELHDQSNSVQSMMKTRQGNDITDRKVLLYIENETKPLWLIRWGMVYDEDQTGSEKSNHTSAIYVGIRTDLSWSIK